MQDFFNGSVNESRYIVVDFVVHTLRERLFQLFQFFLHVLNNFAGITAVVLFKHDGRGRERIFIRINIIKFAVEIDLGYVFKVYGFAFRVGPYNNVFILFRFVVASLIDQHILFGLGGNAGTLPDSTWPAYNALVRDGIHHFL